MPLEAPPETPADSDDGRGMAPASPEKARRRYLVRRSHLMTIIAAWLITVPVSAGVAALLALGLSKWGLPGLGD
jgi:phosphate/sulfate permease